MDERNNEERDQFIGRANPKVHKAFIHFLGSCAVSARMANTYSNNLEDQCFSFCAKTRLVHSR
ncbi:MAG: hypothetical protein P1V97_21775, partial [Planctomycetota bacterium]|nr:hypothetical protein [Planctomycetota bacterium]